VVAQLGWTLQIIYNSTQGRLARYWRPPYGDADARVSAIAKEVFGLTCIIWNHDTGDWQLGAPGGPSPDSIQANMQQWISGPQTPGLMILEHELSQGAVQAFMTAFPLFKQYNWKLESAADIAGNAYQNAYGDTDTPTIVALTAGGNGGAGLIAATSSTSTPPAPTNTSMTSHPSGTAGSGVKKNGVAPSLRSSSLVGTLSVALALALCLI